MATANIKEDPATAPVPPTPATGTIPKSGIKHEETRAHHQPEEADLNPVEAQQSATARLQPPRFAGEGTDTAAAVSAFLTQLADYFRSANTDEAKKPSLLSFCFKPEDSVAARWWATQRDKGVPTETWTQCEALIKARFLTQKSPTEIVALVDSLNQRSTENVKAFADRVDQALIIIAQQRREGMQGLTDAQNKIATAAFHEEQAKTYFLRGLPHHIRAKVQAFEMGTYDACVQAAARVELANRDELRRQPAAYAMEEPRPFGATTERDEIELLKNQIAALQARAAPRRDHRRGPPAEGGGSQRPRWLTSDKVPRDVCYRCGHPGHQARACRTNPNNYNWGKLIKERNLRNTGAPTPQWHPRGNPPRDF